MWDRRGIECATPEMWTFANLNHGQNTSGCFCETMSDQNLLFARVEVATSLPPFNAANGRISFLLVRDYVTPRGRLLHTCICKHLFPSTCTGLSSAASHRRCLHSLASRESGSGSTAMLRNGLIVLQACRVTWTRRRQSTGDEVRNWATT